MYFNRARRFTPAPNAGTKNHRLANALKSRLPIILAHAIRRSRRWSAPQWRFRFGGLRSASESQKDTPPGSKSVAPAAPVSNWALKFPASNSEQDGCQDPSPAEYSCLWSIRDLLALRQLPYK